MISAKEFRYIIKLINEEWITRAVAVKIMRIINIVPHNNDVNIAPGPDNMVGFTVQHGSSYLNFEFSEAEKFEIYCSDKDGEVFIECTEIPQHIMKKLESIYAQSSK